MGLAHLGPAVALGLVLVVSTAGLEHGLLGTASAGNLADSSTAGAGQDLNHQHWRLEARQYSSWQVQNTHSIHSQLIPLISHFPPYGCSLELLHAIHEPFCDSTYSPMT